MLKYITVTSAMSTLLLLTLISAYIKKKMYKINKIPSSSLKSKKSKCDQKTRFQCSPSVMQNSLLYMLERQF